MWEAGPLYEALEAARSPLTTTEQSVQSWLERATLDYGPLDKSITEKVWREYRRHNPVRKEKALAIAYRFSEFDTPEDLARVKKWLNIALGFTSNTIDRLVTELRATGIENRAKLPLEYKNVVELRVVDLL